MPTFDEIWHELRLRLTRGMEVRNWSQDSGYTGKISRVEDLNYDEIVVTGDRTTSRRRVARRDFKKVFDYWDLYKRGRISRAEVLEISRNSTYIFSLLHWLEQQGDR